MALKRFMYPEPPLDLASWQLAVSKASSRFPFAKTWAGCPEASLVKEIHDIRNGLGVFIDLATVRAYYAEQQYLTVAGIDS